MFENWCEKVLGEDEVQRLKVEDREERARFLAHPDCRDPEHPGCYLCRETHDDQRDRA